LVLAVAIALWSCVGRPVMPPPQFGAYSPRSGELRLKHFDAVSGEWTF
jgi:hypothetical protein